jgi:3-hydroxybutyryl-CoA dehydrogenase
MTRPPVSTVGVIGAGTMGLGIAYVFAQAGCAVAIAERDDARAATAPQTITARAIKLQTENRLPAERVEHIRTSVSVVESVDALPIHLDLIVEAVPENLELKLSILAAAERREPVLLASNISALSISLMAKSLHRPQNLIGLHFFNPVWAVPLLEIVRGSANPDEVIAAARDIGHCIGKE